jgi:hypothetical protein
MELGRNRESRSREAAGRRNWPEAVPRKIRGRKRTLTNAAKIREGSEVHSAPSRKSPFFSVASKLKNYGTVRT